MQKKADYNEKKDGFTGERAIILPNSVIETMETSKLLQQLHITDIGHYPIADGHYRKRDIPISQYVLIYCTEGKGWFSINGVKKNVEKDHFFILPPHQAHEYASDLNSPWTIYWIHFKGNLASDICANNLCIARSITQQSDSRIHERVAFFEEIFHTLEMGFSISNLHYINSLFQFFITTLLYVEQYRNAIQKSPNVTDIIPTVIHYMKENIHKKLTLKDMANHVGYSVSHFSSLFYENTGYAPTQYFIRLKMMKACQLLDFTTMKINMICHKIGINDCYYFSRLFHKNIGVSPTEYRKQKKG